MNRDQLEELVSRLPVDVDFDWVDYEVQPFYVPDLLEPEKELRFDGK